MLFFFKYNMISKLDEETCTDQIKYLCLHKTFDKTTEKIIQIQMIYEICKLRSNDRILYKFNSNTS